MKGLFQRWRESHAGNHWHDAECCVAELLDELDADKLRIEKAVKALDARLLLTDDGKMVFHVDRMAVLKIIREIL